MGLLEGLYLAGTVKCTVKLETVNRRLISNLLGNCAGGSFPRGAVQYCTDQKIISSSSDLISPEFFFLTLRFFFSPHGRTTIMRSSMHALVLFITCLFSQLNVLQALAPIIVRGNKMYNAETKARFTMKGVRVILLGSSRANDDYLDYLWLCHG